MTPIAFTLHIVPPKTTAQQKRAVVLPGRGVRFFKRKEQVQAEQTLAALMIAYAPAKPLEGPIKVTIHLSWPYRKAEPKKNRTRAIYHDRRPDLDNLVKGYIDTMTRVGFWTDDGQIAVLTVGKWWSAAGRMEFVIQPLR